MGTLLVQNDFTHGELDPELIARSDIRLYHKGVRQARNVVVKPGGGAKRRFGTLFITEIIATEDQYTLHDFEFSEEQIFLLVFTDIKVEIFLNDILQATVVTPYSGAIVKELKFAQTTNLLVIAHPDFEPRQLRRGATPTAWTLSLIPFSFVPVHDFVTGTYDAQTFNLAPLTIGTNRTLTVTAGTFVFTDAYIGGAFYAAGASVEEPSGYARIVTRTSATEVKVNIIVPFSSAHHPYEGKDCVVAEKAWSNLEPDSSGNRGWPVSCTFYQDRLIFGGSRSLPQSIFGSQVNDFFDFDIGTGLDDEAIIVQLGGNKVNDIKHIIADRSLQVFTFSSEWTVPQLEDAPLTPGNISIKKQTNQGATNVDPVVLDNFTFYVKRGGKGVMAYRFDFDNESYNSTNVSITSTNLIRDPIDSTILNGSTFDDANYLMLANNDGTLAVYQTLSEQGVSAWTLNDTQGEFVRCQEVGDEIYFLIKRTIETVDKFYLEKLDFFVFMDSQKTSNFGSPTSIITGLDHLDGKTVKVKGDDFVQPDRIVVNGQITIEEAAKKVEVGLGFEPFMEILPVIIQSQQGPTNYIPKRINRIFVQFFESLGIFVNGENLIPNLLLNNVFTPDTLTPSGEPQTGSFQLYNEGWYISPQGRVSEKQPKTITIEQFDPLPMTVLAIGYEVTV